MTRPVYDFSEYSALFKGHVHGVYCISYGFVLLMNMQYSLCRVVLNFSLMQPVWPSEDSYTVIQPGLQVVQGLLKVSGGSLYINLSGSLQ